jgi:hypothetical protein
VGKAYSCLRACILVHHTAWHSSRDNSKQENSLEQRTLDLISYRIRCKLVNSLAAGTFLRSNSRQNLMSLNLPDLQNVLKMMQSFWLVHQQMTTSMFLLLTYPNPHMSQGTIRICSRHAEIHSRDCPYDAMVHKCPCTMTAKVKAVQTTLRRCRSSCVGRQRMQRRPAESIVGKSSDAADAVFQYHVRS